MNRGYLVLAIIWLCLIAFGVYTYKLIHKHQLKLRKEQEVIATSAVAHENNIIVFGSSDENIFTTDEFLKELALRDARIDVAVTSKKFDALKKKEIAATVVDLDSFVKNYKEDLNAVIILSCGQDYSDKLLVIRRDIIIQNPNLVKNFAKAYFSTIFNYKLSGINAKNNYAYFNINGKSQRHLDSDLLKIIRVTGDPTHGKLNTLYYDDILRSLYKENFHPISQVVDVQDWSTLKKVEISFSDLQFYSGNSTLNDFAVGTLTEVCDLLTNFPQYYLVINSSSNNNDLSNSRANSVIDFLVEHGIDKKRMQITTNYNKDRIGVSLELKEIEF